MQISLAKQGSTLRGLGQLAVSIDQGTLTERGRLNTVDLLITVAGFLKNANIFLSKAG